MIPQGVDVPDLAEQLDQDSVAFTNPVLAGDPGAQADAQASLRDGDGIAVVDIAGGSPADYRDVAQELQDATGLDTVIVQSPGTISVVSDSLSRAEIESAQAGVPTGLVQSEALDAFYAGVDQTPFSYVSAAMVMVAVLAVVGAIWAFRRAVGGVQRTEPAPA
ncbi:DUF6676 family protein [Corynebacterium sp. LK2590]|uniref:Rv1476 family membrane protein n=1 Tax=unclassified Corynebacterium TaxID=2624378 RepID=UPI0034CDE701